MTTQSYKTQGAAAILAASLTTVPASAQDAAPGDHVVQFVRFESQNSRDEVLAAAAERKPAFEATPGLVQKYYLELDAPNTYGGIYIWDSKASMAAFLKSDLFAGIPAAYGIASKPQVEIIPILFPLR